MFFLYKMIQFPYVVLNTHTVPVHVNLLPWVKSNKQ